MSRGRPGKIVHIDGLKKGMARTVEGGDDL